MLNALCPLRIAIRLFERHQPFDRQDDLPTEITLPFHVAVCLYALPPKIREQRGHDEIVG